MQSVLVAKPLARREAKPDKIEPKLVLVQLEHEP